MWTAGSKSGTCIGIIMPRCPYTPSEDFKISLGEFPFCRVLEEI